jgi:hypothetical protein
MMKSTMDTAFNNVPVLFTLAELYFRNVMLTFPQAHALQEAFSP